MNCGSHNLNAEKRRFYGPSAGCCCQEEFWIWTLLIKLDSKLIEKYFPERQFPEQLFEWHLFIIFYTKNTVSTLSHRKCECVTACWKMCSNNVFCCFSDSQGTRSILRKLDKIIAFPEETALLLRDYEHNLFSQTTVSTLLAGLTHNLAAPKLRKGEWLMQKFDSDLRLFQKLVSHFYLV